MRRMNDHQQAEDSIDHKFIWVSRWVGWCISQSGLDTTNASGAALRMHRDFCSDAHASKDTNEKCKNTKIIAKGTTEPGINYFNRINNWKNETISFTSHKPNSHRSDCKWRNLGQTSAWFGLAEGKNIYNN